VSGEVSLASPAAPRRRYAGVAGTAGETLPN
jgi:hypothetical protein